jgi:polyribonucleotide nucleotidyltransferase
MNLNYNESIEINRESLMKNETGSFSVLVQQNGISIYGTLVFYPETTNSAPGMFDIHYLDKHVAINKHPSGFMKFEHRKPTKGRIIISRFIDRAIRPIISSNRGFQIILRLLNFESGIPHKCALAAASDLLLQANLIEEPVYLHYESMGEFYLAASFYQGHVSMLEGSCDEISKEELAIFLKKGFEKSRRISKSHYSFEKRLEIESSNYSETNSAAIGLTIQLFQKVFKKSIS